MINQKGSPREVGAIPIPILVAVIGLISFLAISSTVFFKDNFFQKLYPKPLSQAATSSYFRVGTGFIDNVPRQIIRTNTDKLYIFAGQAESSPILRVHYTTAAGFPTSGTNFNTTTQLTEPAAILSVDASYDGVNIMHVFTNLQNGNLIDQPFDVTTNAFKPGKTISTGNPTISGSYLGTTGVSSSFDKTGNLHVAYWGPSNQIMYKSYTYNSATDTLTQTSGPTRLDSSGNANHPELVISPLDNSVTVSWINGTNGAGTMSARVRSASGAWGSVEAVSAGAVWTSPNSGINIDQGPSMVITSDGVKHVIYIENFDGTGDYGHLHYVRNSGSGWVDSAVPSFYTHAPGIATNSLNEIYVLGHGHPNNSACQSMQDLCSIKRNSNGTWATPVTFAVHPGSDSFDASVSVKWSVVGWNAPETIEFAFFSANNGSYQNTSVWYGRLDSVASSPSPTVTPTPTASQSPSATPTPSASPSPSLSPTPVPSGLPITATFQISSSSDDVNDVVGNSTYTETNSTIWLGNAGFTTGSFTGLRFNNVTIPKGATITSAKLEVTSSQNQWIGYSFDISAENISNSLVFSSSNKPSQRSLTLAKVTHNDDLSWTANTNYQLDEIKNVIQEVIDRADWSSGNSLSVITQGTGTGTFGRKFVTSFDGSSINAPKLIVTYTVPSASLPGDIIVNGKVDIFDYNALLSDFGKTSNFNPLADIVVNGRIDIFDYNALLLNFGRTMP